MSDINKSIETVKESWINSPYYDTAEKWTHIFWQTGTIFKKYFDELDLKCCAELACGHGRHSEQLLQQYSEHVERLYCLDVIEDNVSFTTRRLAASSQANVWLISGSDFKPIPSNSLTSIFCYDAMVHFSPDIVESYLIDASRVLVPGGKALFHHSNLNAPETGGAQKHYGSNPHARNHMTFDLFELFTRKAGLRILKTSAIRWADVLDLDRITLLERPRDEINIRRCNEHNPERKKLIEILWKGRDPFAGYNDELKPDLQGFGSNHGYLAEAVLTFPGKCIVLEVGVWKGMSVINMASKMKENGIPGAVIAVDTWLGSWDHWLHGDGNWLNDLAFKNGYPTLYSTFASNVISQGLADYIIPLPLDSINAAYIIEKKGIRPNVIHIDAGHDYDAVMTDLKVWYPLLAPGGILIGDDYYPAQHWPGVRKAFDEYFGDASDQNFEHQGGKCRIMKPA